MGRTNKQGIAKSKSLKQKNKKSKSSGGQEYYHNIARRPFKELKNGGMLETIANPAGNTYHWFTKGRRSCYETKLKLDPDGFSKFKQIPLSNGTYHKSGSSWLRKKLRRVLKNK